MISTHAIYKKLVTKGMSDELAETMTEIMEEKQDNLVTKGDLKLLRGELKSDMAKLESTLQMKIADLKSDIMSWAVPAIIGILSLNVAILGAIIALWFSK